MKPRIDPPRDVCEFIILVIIVLSCLFFLILSSPIASAISYAPNGTTGLTLVVDTNVDDSYYSVNLPFPITFLNTSYSTIYVGTNGYITFTAGSSIYSGMSASAPSGPHVNIYPADRRLLKLYYARLNANTATDKFVIRQEGVDYTNQNIPNVWEVHFYPNTNYFDIFFITTPGGNITTVGVSNGTSYITTVLDTALTGQRINSDGTAEIYTPYVSSISGAQTIRKNNLITNRDAVTSNNIYIDQVGDNNTFTIDQQGNNNSIGGINQQRAILYGNNNTVTIRQGDPIDSVGKNLIKLESNGNNNTLNLMQGRSAVTALPDGAESNNHILSLSILGGSNNVTSKQSNDGGSNSGHFAEVNIIGNTNTFDLLQGNNSVKTFFGSIVGNSNNLTASQTGTGSHFLDVTLNGNGHTVNANQSGAGSHAGTINLTNIGGASTVNMTQNGSIGQIYSITQMCANSAGCSTSITQP